MKFLILFRGLWYWNNVLFFFSIYIKVLVSKSPMLEYSKPQIQRRLSKADEREKAEIFLSIKRPKSKTRAIMPGGFTVFY